MQTGLLTIVGVNFDVADRASCIRQILHNNDSTVGQHTSYS